jgi:hypothetical protein
MPAADEHVRATEAVTPPHPTAEQVDRLFALAVSCREPKEGLGRRLREIMGLAGDVRISKKFLSATMTTTQYDVAVSFDKSLLKRQVEEDVPDGKGAADLPALQPTPAPSAEGTSGPFTSSSSALEGTGDPIEAERAKLRAEVATWALRVGKEEREYMITHHPYARASTLPWQARLHPSGDA